MVPAKNFTSSSAAIKLSHWLDAYANHGYPRLPVDVNQLALAIGSQLGWDDRITKVEAFPLNSFEGGLFKLDNQSWALLYNGHQQSSGRIRFTQAHELGHFLLHRAKQDRFECSVEDIIHWGADLQQLESEADDFAAKLLLPLTHFRSSIQGQPIDFEILSAAAEKFGVSLTAACLRWIHSTEDSAVLIFSRDGFINWSVSSDRAFKNGAFIKTKNKVVELPAGSIAGDENRSFLKLGEKLSLKTWFQHAHQDAEVREMKLSCDNYGYVLTLLHLSRSDKTFPPGNWDTI